VARKFGRVKEQVEKFGKLQERRREKRKGRM
jgi:hypothetical protein